MGETGASHSGLCYKYTWWIKRRGQISCFVMLIILEWLKYFLADLLLVIQGMSNNEKINSNTLRQYSQWFKFSDLFCNKRATLSGSVLMSF